MNYQTTTNDPIVLDWIKQRAAALEAWRTAMDEEQRLYAERSPLHPAALTKLDQALEALRYVELNLCVSFIWALEHPSEVKAS